MRINNANAAAFNVKLIVVLATAPAAVAVILALSSFSELCWLLRFEH